MKREVRDATADEILLARAQLRKQMLDQRESAMVTLGIDEAEYAALMSEMLCPRCLIDPKDCSAH